MLLNKKNKGIALIVVYFAIVILSILGGALFMQSFNESKMAQRHKLSAEALSIAEAGIERALYDLRRDYINDSTPSWADGDINGISCGPDTSAFYTLHGATALGTGSYTVTLKNIIGSTNCIWIRSTGTTGGVTRTVEVYGQMKYVFVWDNAIFAGSGASGTLINGNVDIRGSVHILGTGLNIDDLAVDMAIDLGGSANIGNNYAGMDSALSSKIPSLDTVLFNGELVETLNAALRVKQGIVGLSGSATIGDPDVTGNSYKETLDAVYVTDGFGGNKGTTNVYSDNGTNNTYDLGDSVTFPSLSDPRNGYPTHTDYLRANGLVISDSAALAALSNVTPESTFSYTGSGGSISMDGAGNLAIDGIVVIDGGNLNINASSVGDTITYTGTGSILVTGDVSINASVVTPATTPGISSFPDNVIGIMTPNNITFDTSQIDVMGLFYAENEINAAKQTDILGTFISNYFNMSSQVPSIYQVPGILDNLPPGIIGSDPSYSIDIKSWQEK